MYEDDSLEGKKSLTIRLFLQSMDGTLGDRDIDETIKLIIDKLKEQYGASLRCKR